jgi:murein DD-endopeptidase MepM/ murein hydrolase activator NlpD
MLKMFSGLALIGLFFACFLTYIYQNVMFPATLTVAAELALAGSVPGYAGEIGQWMLADGETDYGSPYQASVLTPFDGYEGPAGFYSCGPYFIDTDQVVISSRFHEFRGWDEDCGCSLWHGGIDYATLSPDLNPPLLAPISGKVVFAAWSRSGYGNLVVIENVGVRVYLAHLSAIYISEGTILSAGDLVGAIGSTGNSSGPHLHLEVRARHPENENYGLVVDPSSIMLPGQSEPCNWAPGEGRYLWNLR